MSNVEAILQKIAALQESLTALQAEVSRLSEPKEINIDIKDLVFHADISYHEDDGNLYAVDGDLLCHTVPPSLLDALRAGRVVSQPLPDHATLTSFTQGDVFKLRVTGSTIADNFDHDDAADVVQAWRNVIAPAKLVVATRAANRSIGYARDRLDEIVDTLKALS